MQLLVIRHADAGTAAAFAASGEDDALRPLSTGGRRKMAEGAKGLHRLVPKVDLLAASPLVRAQQTAAIVAERYGDIPIVTAPVLQPDSAPAAFLTWLRKQEGDTVAVVGHEPHLGTLVTWLLTGLAESRVSLSKGGACLLELASPPKKGEAMLEWALTGSQLRRMGG
jgi:phosphohistidine phosphatase